MNEENTQENQELTENVEESTQDQSSEQETSNSNEQAESDKEKNWIDLRRKADQAQRERDEALRILQQIKEAQQAQNTPAPQEEPDVEISIKDDDLVEGKHLSAYQKKLKRLEAELNKYQKQSYESQIESRLKSQYSDFDSVVNSDNINKLRNEYPEIASTLHSTGDLYNKAVSAYTIIKKLGIDGSNNYLNEQKQVKDNTAKPRSSISVSPQQGESPLQRANAFANGLTKELQAELLKEMTEARKRY